MMRLYNVFAAAFILCVTSSYCEELKFTVAASIDEDSLPCVNDTGCESSVDEAEEPASEVLMKVIYTIENNAKLQEQRLNNNAKAAFIPFKDDDDDELLFENNTTYLTYMKVNSDFESNHIPLCKPQKEENYLYDCTKIRSVKFACIGAKKDEIAECESFKKTDYPVPVCAESSSKKFIICGRNSSDFLCFPRNGKKSPIEPCFNKERHICLFGSGVFKECQNLKAVSENKETENTFKESPQGDSIERKESVLMNLCIDGSDNKLLPCSKDPPSSSACINPIDGKIELCENLEKIHEIGVPICIQKSTYGLVTCGKFSSVKLCISDNSKSAFRVCKGNARAACFKNGSFQYCEEKRLISRSADSKYSQEYQFLEGYSTHDKELLYQSSKGPAKWDTEMCVLNVTARKFVPCSSVSSNPILACFGFQTGTIRACEVFSKYELVHVVCHKIHKMHPREREVNACGKVKRFVKLCYSTEGEEPMEPCDDVHRRVCLNSNNTLAKCPDRDIFPKETSNTKFPPISNLTMDALSNKQKLCVVDTRKSKFHPCTGKNTDKKACYGYEIAAIRECVKFTDDELVSQVCLEKNLRNKLVTCNGSSISFCIRITAGEQEISPCEADEIYACLDDEGSIIKCNGIGLSQRTGSIDEKFIRLQCENCSIDNTFRVIGKHPDVLPEFDRLIFLS